MRLHTVCAAVGLTIAVFAVTGHVAGGQTPVPPSADGRGTASGALPIPVMSAEFAEPTQSIDWRHYQLPEGCEVVFERALAVADYQERRDTLERVRDTLDRDPWTPVAPSALAAIRPCLRRFSAATLPAFAWPRMLRLAVAANLDSDVTVLVTRQLAAVHGIPARAAVLDTVLTLLMGGDHLTTAHVQMARVFSAQLDALGPEAIVQRLEARDLLMRPAELARDLDAQQAGVRDKLQLLQQPKAAALPALSAVVQDIGGRDVTLRERMIWRLQHELLVLRYLQTLSLADLARVRAPIDAVTARMGMSPLQLEGEAPRVHCDVYFPAPPARTASSAPPIPAPGALSLLLFWGGGTETVTLYPLFRRLEHIPGVAFTIVTHTDGTLANRLLTEHPEQEAALKRAYIVDSLGIHGAVCVTKTEFWTAPDGHAVPGGDPNTKAYKVSGDMNLVVVDPAGAILSGGALRVVDDQDLVWYLQRLRKTYAKGVASSTAQTPLGSP